MWREADLDAALSPNAAALARRAFGTTPEGTFVDEATGRHDGTNVLFRADEAAFADARFPALRERLLAARAHRPRPGLDDKALADGNGLMLAALAAAGRTLGDAHATAEARRTAYALLGTFATPGSGLWHRAPTGTEPGVPGLTEDDALLAVADRGLAQGSDEHPSGETMRLAAALRADAPVAVVAGRRSAPDTEALIAALRGVYAPGATIGLRDPDDSSPLVGNDGQTMRGEQAVAYVCRNGACQEPTADPERARALLHASG